MDCAAALPTSRCDHAIALLQSIEHFGGNSITDPGLDLHCDRFRAAQDVNRALRLQVPGLSHWWASASSTRWRWRRRCRRRTKPERGVGNFQNIVTLCTDDRNVGSHPGLQFQISVIHSDDRVVGDNILDGRGRVSNLDNIAMENAPRESVDREIHFLPDIDGADIRFGDGGVDLHFRQIIGNRENHRCAQAGSHGLPNVDTSGNDDAVDRRSDGAMLEVDLGFCNAPSLIFTFAWA